MVLCAGPLVARADEPPQYTLTSWTARDGLPSSYVLSLAQDREGYLWVGTNAGLVRFDGQRFSPWPRSGAFPSPNPLIYTIYSARDGALWVATATHVMREHGGKITVFAVSDGVPQVTRSIIESHDGTIWAGGTSGLARFRDGRWQPVEVGGTVRTPINTIFEDSQRRLWISTAGSIFRQDGDRFVQVPASTDGPVRFAQRDGALLVASATTDLTVIGLDASPRAEKLVSLPITRRDAPEAWGRASWRDVTLPAHLDSLGSFWVGTNGNGLLRIAMEQGRVTAHYTERDGLSGDLVRAVLEDRDGNIWVGTHSGLTRVTPSSIRSVAVQTGATAEDISTVVVDHEGAVWVEAPGALVRVANGSRTVFREGAGAPFDRISAMHADAQGRVWVATADGRVIRRVSERFEPVILPADFSGAVISGIASDSHGTIWMYDGRRLLTMHADGRRPTVAHAPSEIAGVTVRFILADSKGRVWIAGDGARLARYDGTTFRLFTDEHGVPPGNPSGVHEDKTGRLWISSDSGLSTFHNDRLVTLTTANGLPRNRVYFVTEDDDGRIWLGTGSGLMRVEREELEKAIANPRHQMRLRLYDASDGLRGTPVARGYPTAARTPAGIWFVTSTGVAVIDPRHLREQLSPPVPRIEQVLVDGRAIDVSDGLELPATTTSLQIEYAALMLTSPTKVRFRHRLDGVDSGWVDDGDVRRTVYAHLPGGSYRFNVAASSGDGVWTSDVAAWTFIVPPQWYQTRLFYGAALAVLALALWGTWQLRVRQIKRRFADVLRERARVGREIHDTLLQSLVGMALQLDTVAKAEDPAEVKEEVGRIRRQVEHYIGEAQQSIWDLRSPRLESGDLATRLRERAERILQQAGIGFEFTVVGTPRPMAPSVDQQILRIGMEAVVNAVRHAQATHVRMELAYEGESVRLRITDDGHGFNPDAVTDKGESHWGLSIMRERAEQVGGRFTVASAPDRGTSIEITAPCGATA